MPFVLPVTYRFPDGSYLALDKHGDGISHRFNLMNGLTASSGWTLRDDAATIILQKTTFALMHFSKYMTHDSILGFSALAIAAIEELRTRAMVEATDRAMAIHISAQDQVKAAELAGRENPVDAAGDEDDDIRGVR